MSIPLRLMKPGPNATFIVEGSDKTGPIFGVLVGLHPGRARVITCKVGGTRKDPAGGVIVESDRFETDDWSPNTNVRRMTKEEMAKMVKMKRKTANPGGELDTNPQTASATKDRIQKLKDKAAKKAEAKGPKAPREKKAKVFSPCGCGCGEKVPRRFRPGHDARFYSWLRKIVRGDMKIKDLSEEVRTIHKIRTSGDVEKLLADHSPTQVRGD